MNDESLFALANRYFSAAPTGTLYHYTSVSGLMGIVKSKSLYATDVRYLNDMNEVQHVFKLIEEARHRKRNDGDAMIEVQKKVNAVDADFAEFMESMKTEPTSYVSCLTGQPSLLSQWRGYCPSHKGVSIGFLAQDLAASAMAQSFTLGKCRYPEPPQQREIADELLRGVAMEVITKTVRNTTERARMMTAFDSLFRFALLIKSHQFSEEQEWRLVSPHQNRIGPTHPLEFREGRSMLIPFRRFQLPTNAEGGLKVEHVILGPTPHAGAAQKAVAQFLATERSSPARGVDYCDIPLREA